MNPVKTRLALLASLALLSATPPVLAVSSTASSASEGVSTSVGSLSDSVKGSSNSSSGDAKVAEGQYRITDVAAVDGQPGTVQLTLQAVANTGAAGELQLLVPQRTVEQSGLAAGQVVQARHRPYGVEFAKAADGTAFFLALTDGWLRELQNNPVTL
jgi:hypothetical protein